MWPGSGPPRVKPSAARLRRRSARPDDDGGAVAIIVALLTTVFVGLAALVVDHGLSADTQRRAQNAADAAALAAAVALSAGGTPVAADTSAKQYAAADFGVTLADWSTCTTTLPSGFAPVSGSPCISQNTATKQVRVVLPRRTFPTIFAGIAGFSSQTVTQAATAGYGAPPGSRCVLCIMGALSGDTGDIVVAGGDAYAHDISFNNVSGFIHVTGGTIGYTGTFNGNGDFQPGPPQPTPAVPDPFLAIPQPTVDTTKVAVAGAGACSPANYYYDISGCTSFAAGIYVLLGIDEHIVTVSATNVMFFMTCSTNSGSKKSPVITAHPCVSTGEAGANFGGAGNTGVTLTGLTTDPTYKGFALWVDRNNTTAQKWTGNADFTVAGTAYSANAAGIDSTNGNGIMTVKQGTMVIGSLQMKGHHLHISVDGTGNTTGGGNGPVIPRLSR